MALEGELNASLHAINCDDCAADLPLEVLHSNAGYYIGRFCPNCGPFSRESDYFASRAGRAGSVAFGQRAASRPRHRLSWRDTSMMSDESDANVLYALGQGIGQIVEERDRNAQAVAQREYDLANSRAEVARLTKSLAESQATLERAHQANREANNRIKNAEHHLAKLDQVTANLETMVAHLQGLMRTRAKGTAARREMLKPVVLHLHSILDFEVNGVVRTNDPTGEEETTI